MNPHESHKPKSGERGAARPTGQRPAREDPDDVERRARLKALGTIFGGFVLIGGLALALLWGSASSRAFFLRDAATGENVSDPLLAVVLDGRHAPKDAFPTRVTRLKPDLFGRYEPAPLEGDEVSELFFYHIAYRPLAKAQPSGGALAVEKHGGNVYPDVEAQLRQLGALSPDVKEALRAAFLPESREAIVVAAAPASSSAASSSGGSTAPGADEGEGTELELPIGPGPSGPEATTASAAAEKERREADLLAREIEEVLRMQASRSIESKKKRAALLETLDLYNDIAPKDARLRGSAFLMRMVSRGLEDRKNHDLPGRLVTLAGALWHGTGSPPPPFTGMGALSLGWPEDARRQVAVAAARIGGASGGKELATLVRAGKAAVDAPLLESADAGGSRKALLAALGAALAATPPPTDEEKARLTAARTALEAPPAHATPAAPTHTAAPAPATGTAAPPK